MSIIQLEEHQHLFRNGPCYLGFATALRSALEADRVQVVMNGREVIGILTPARSKLPDVLFERLCEAVRERPEILDEIREGLEDEDLVDAPPPEKEEEGSE